MKGLRDLFKYTKTLFAYKLTGGGVEASNTFATAKYAGVRGNDLKIAISANVDVPADFDVKTYIGTQLIDSQTVTTAAELVDNDFVTFKPAAVLAVTASTPLAGGTNMAVDGTAHQAFLDMIESYSFNVIGVVATDLVTNQLYSAFCKRLRDEQGIKFQTVTYKNPADYEGNINIKK